MTEIKQTQTFFHGTDSNLTPPFFLSKYIKAFQWLSKSEFLNFMTKGNPNNGNGSFHVKSSDNPGTFNLPSQK